MTYAERQARGSALCHKLGEAITRIEPLGVASWVRTYRLVDGPTVEFMVALSGWEIDPTDAAVQRVHDAYDAVMESWRSAAAEYTAERSEA